MRSDPVKAKRVSSKRVTSADVARLAGVSRATVSYVVNGVPDIKITAATRERVLDAAAELGYSQFGPGRTLKSGRSDVVLFVLQDLPVGHALNLMLDELAVRLAAIDLSLVMFRLSQRGNPLSRIWREIGPCAVIGMETINDAEADEMLAAGIDVFRLNLGTEDGSGALTQSQLEVGETQVRHLVAGGHRRLGYAYPDDPRVEAFARLRRQGAMAAAERLGLPPMDVVVVPIDRDAAAAALKPWVTRAEPITGVVAYNDIVALATLAGLQRNGVNVPREVAVIGVDDDPLGAVSTPTLTTIDAGHLATADELARLVTLARQGDPDTGAPIPHPNRVIVRESAP
jgi:DNA-binding LacI/PurR family transcriptional regulator